MDFRFSSDGKIDITVPMIVTEMLKQDGGLRKFIRAMPPNQEWQLTVSINLILPNNVLALELLDKIEEQEFQEKNK